MSPTPFQWSSLKTRVTLFTLGILLFSVWLLAFFISRQLRDDMERVLGEQQLSSVSVIAHEINDRLSDRRKALETIAKDVTPAMLGNASALQALLEQRPLLQLLFNGGNWITGQDGVVVASNLPALIGTSYANREYMTALFMQGKPWISKPIRGKVLNDPIIVMVVPIRDTQGKVVGVLSGVTDLSKPNFLDQIQTRHGKSGGYVLIAAPYRLVITATDKSRIMEALPAAGVNAWVDRFAEGYEGSAVAVNPKGVEVLVSGKGIPEAGWYMLDTLPTADAFAPIDAIQQRMLLSAVLVSMLTSGLTWWLLTQMLQRQLAPMLKVTRALTTQVAADHPAQALPVTSQDEIGELIRGFNRLLETLSQREDAMRESQRVAHLGGWSIDLASGQLSWTEETFHIHEIPVGEQPSVEQAINFYLPDSRKLIEESVKTALESGTPFDLELQIKTAREHIRWVHARGEAIHKEGVPSVVSGTFQDITERKNAERALRDSEMRFRRSIEEAPFPIMIHGEGGAVLAISRAWTEITGYTIRDIPTISEWTTRAYGKESETINSYIDTIYNYEHRVSEGEYQVRCRDGSERTWDFSSVGLGTMLDGRRVAISIAMDVTERKAAEMALAERKSELQELYQSLQTLREDERTRIARELHDGLGHLLTAMRMDLDWIDAKLPKDGSPVSVKLTSAVDLSEQVVDAVRSVMENLRPPILDELGLVAALEGLVADFTTRTGVRCDLVTSGEHPKPYEGLATDIFRIVQEALNNVLKHANATQASVSLTMADDNIMLVVQDDGKGLVATAKDGRETFGVRGMRERVSILGGTFTVTSTPGRGVRLEAVFPTNIVSVFSSVEEQR